MKFEFKHNLERRIVLSLERSLEPVCDVGEEDEDGGDDEDDPGVRVGDVGGLEELCDGHPDSSDDRDEGHNERDQEPRLHTLPVRVVKVDAHVLALITKDGAVGRKIYPIKMKNEK